MTAIKKFLQLEAAAGLILLFTTLLALIVANSGLSVYYEMLIQIPAGIHIGELSINKPILLWVNDGLMAAFFFLVGLELKRELLEGHLAEPKNTFLPLFGAVGGMVIPALIYLVINYQDESNRIGWAIPAATDIAFALGILMLLGKQVPASLKVFLVTLAIIDDIGAIVIIALFYTQQLETAPLLISATCLMVLTLLNRKGVTDIPAYMFVGGILWVAVLKSGVHATLAGVLLAFFIPMRDQKKPEHSPVKQLESSLHSSVAFVILPLFAFANAGIDFRELTIDAISHPITVGIALGLLIGKPLGIMSMCYIATKLGIAKLPAEITWRHIFGASVLCGIGFTMSLFIGSLAFETTGSNIIVDERLGILMASLIAAIAGYTILKFAPAPQASDEQIAQEMDEKAHDSSAPPPPTNTTRAGHAMSMNVSQQAHTKMPRG
ncbi:Na+/H+ antiporter NhaA [Thalassotalea euphylliae]|uniref:Na(+)/H(+) antiporter NhaA n=1 Tax=Thalassotalea euphylliae TaxID=1655234 RepID=A0A3E0TRD2_9GAMM|nr:Na+/H+ antiporter NhaA [Thalassotalea euphylliae]REL26485.1 Na+/H+ antiporter NhaA [Thalassotalea euphylliae]